MAPYTREVTEAQLGQNRAFVDTTAPQLPLNELTGTHSTNPREVFEGILWV